MPRRMEGILDCLNLLISWNIIFEAISADSQSIIPYSQKSLTLKIKILHYFKIHTLFIALIMSSF